MQLRDNFRQMLPEVLGVESAAKSQYWKFIACVLVDYLIEGWGCDVLGAFGSAIPAPAPFKWGDLPEETAAKIQAGVDDYLKWLHENGEAA